jgi:glycosyltransferase involved in cell wall biosynthesis
MHILIIPSWYPTEQNKINGIFFQEQAKAIAKYDVTNQVGVISATYLSSLLALKTKNYSYGIKKTFKNNFSELLFSFPAIPKNKYLNHAIASYFCKKLFLDYIEKNGVPDIIHLHSFEMGELVLWIKDKYKIPFIYTEHATTFYRGNLTQKEKVVVQKIVNNASFNFAVSQELSQFLSDTFNIDFQMMPNFIDTQYFRCQYLKKENFFTFINIAGLSANKNHKLLLYAFKQFHKQFPNTKLLIYGDGPEKNNLESLIKHLHLGNSVTLGGKIGREEVKKRLCQSHCFVLSSEVETFGVLP